MDTTTRTAIITAAVNAVGNSGDPATWQALVTEKAIEIAAMIDEKSDVSKAVAAIGECKVFRGTVVSVKKEASSTRGIITLHTGTEQGRKDLPAGYEQVRTERTDNPLGRALALKMRELIGQSVLLYVQVEEYNNGAGKVRVLRHAVPLGVDPEAQAKIDGFAPVAA